MELSHLSLNDQLLELEDQYAECLIDEVDVSTLAQLWNHIKELRRQLTLPIYQFTTPEALKK